MDAEGRDARVFGGNVRATPANDKVYNYFPVTDVDGARMRYRQARYIRFMPVSWEGMDGPMTGL